MYENHDMHFQSKNIYISMNFIAGPGEEECRKLDK